MALAALTLACVACGQIDGTRPFAGTSLYQAPSGNYTLRFLSPPWIFIANQGDIAQFAVAQSAFSTNFSHAAVLLAISPQSENAQHAALSSYQSYETSHPTDQFPIVLKPMTNDVGQTGVQFAADNGTVTHHREVYYDGKTGSYELAFDASVDLLTPEVDDLIQGFSCDGPKVGAGS
jgi:hypothetical protein